MSERPLAVITGASSGIGAVFARKLAARGYDLVLIARREDRLRSLAWELEETYRVVAEPLRADLARDDDLECVAARIRSASGLGLLVNNAGFGTLGFFNDADPLGQDRMQRLHVLATMRLTHAALANLMPRRTGGVINVSSVAAFGQAPQNAGYCASKAWINSFTESLAMELAVQQSPVKVQALCPGFTLSEFHDTLGMKRDPIPKFLWLTADFVVNESLRGFDRGQCLVIPGWRYKLIVAGMKALPGPMLRRATMLGARFRKRSN
jgi:short-subunit dehydrogenase